MIGVIVSLDQIGVIVTVSVSVNIGVILCYYRCHRGRGVGVITGPPALLPVCVCVCVGGGGTIAMFVSPAVMAPWVITARAKTNAMPLLYPPSYANSMIACLHTRAVRFHVNLRLKD